MERPLILNRYRPLEESIQGGMSTVEIAWDTRIQRRVAIKRIPLPQAGKSGHITDAGGRGAAGAASAGALGAASSEDMAAGSIPGLAEARTAALLANPSIVQVYDFECDSDEAFIIMEYIDGPTLSVAVDLEDGMLSLDEAAAVVQAASDALGYAHENGVLHLDIKPDNILLSTNGSIKIADFGMSELESAAGYGKAQGGTIGYMPPEQLTGEDIDVRTDEWALASVVYEMLTGENPFYSNDIDRSLENIEHFEIALPSECNTDLDPGIDDIILRALSPEPEGRFPTVEDFADALKPYLGDAARGRKELRVLIEPENLEEHEEAPSGIGLWDRLSDRGRESIARTCAAICCAWLTYTVTYASVFPLAVVLTLTAAVLAGGILAPALCAALTLIVVGGSLVMCQQVLPGIIVLAAGAVWWLLIGRGKSADASLPFAAPVLGLIKLTPAFPLLCGFALPVKRATVAAAAGGLLAMLVSAWTQGSSIGVTTLHGIYTPELISPLVTRLTDPSAWITVAAWVFAAILMSALCSRGSRALSILGSGIGSAIMLGGQAFAGFVGTGAWAFPDTATTVSVVLAFVLMCIIAALGAPYRAEEDAEGE